jgi:phosphonate transport system substrate-binding protein
VGMLLVAALFFAHRLIASRPIDATISLNGDKLPVSNADSSPGARLHVGVAHITSPVPSFRRYQALTERLAAAAECEAEMLHPDSYKAINAMLRQGKVDVAFVCSGGYAAEPDAMDVLAAPLIDGKMEYYGYIIVPQTSPCQTFADLRGKSFLFVEEESNTGEWYPCRLACKELGPGQKAGAFFGATKFTGAHDLSILAIASKLADGAAISSNVYDHMLTQEPTLKERVRILARSEPFPSPPVVVRKTMPQQLRERLLHVLVTLHETEDGRDILRALDCERFVPARNEDYARIEPCRL